MSGKAGIQIQGCLTPAQRSQVWLDLVSAVAPSQVGSSFLAFALQRGDRESFRDRPTYCQELGDIYPPTPSYSSTCWFWSRVSSVWYSTAHRPTADTLTHRHGYWATFLPSSSSWSLMLVSIRWHVDFWVHMLGRRPRPAHMHTLEPGWRRAPSLNLFKETSSYHTLPALKNRGPRVGGPRVGGATESEHPCWLNLSYINGSHPGCSPKPLQRFPMS